MIFESLRSWSVAVPNPLHSSKLQRLFGAIFKSISLSFDIPSTVRCEAQGYPIETWWASLVGSIVVLLLHPKYVVPQQLRRGLVTVVNSLLFVFHQLNRRLSTVVWVWS
jgi:hypothetical protein